MTQQFEGFTKYSHDKGQAVGILLTNLGTPDAPRAPELRRYLRQFLSDPRVIELPRALWWFILNVFILTFRPRKSAELYRRIWTSEGSPLLSNTLLQAAALQKALRERFGNRIEVEAGMRYGNPSIGSALRALRDRGATRLLVLPLYPQYSATTSGSTFDEVTDVLRRWRWVPDFRMLTQFPDHPGYINALAQSVREFWSNGGRPEKLLFSFHGIPKRYFLSGDPYHCFCQRTARLVAESLGLAAKDYLVCFQSQFGREEWLQPYTIETVERLGREGVRSLDVICPGFPADCLETLEEIALLNKKTFLEAGGKSYRYIPALNARPDFIAALADLAAVNCGGWLTPKEHWDQTAEDEHLATTNSRYLALAGNQNSQAV